MTNVKRVVICTQTFPPRMGGMEAVIYSLACQLAERGVEVFVAGDKPYSGNLSFEYQSFNVPKVLRSTVRRLSLGLWQQKPDVVICDSWKSVQSVPNWNAKLIVLAHGQEYLEPSSKKAQRIRSALDKAHLVIASSKMTSKLVAKIAPKSNVEVIYPTYMLSNPQIAERRAQNPVPSILTLCRIERRKGLFESALALAQLKNRGLKFSWTIAGNGPDLNDLKSEISKLNLSSSTTFAGRVDDQTKAELLERADLFLMPSYQSGKSLEGFGISYIEAASYGVPAVAGTAGGAPEAVLNGITGWCVDGSDAQKVQLALTTALTEEDLRAAYGDAAAARFSTEFLGDVVFEKFLKLLQT